MALGYVSGAVASAGADARLRDSAAALGQACAQRGWALELVHDLHPDQARGRDRPGLAYALARLTAGEAPGLVVAQLGQLCRSVAELGQVLAALRSAGARVVSLEPALDTGSALGSAAADVLIAVSEFERARLAEQGRRGLAAARRQGVTRPAIDPALKRRIKRMRAAGMTMQAIADELNDARVPTVRGGSRWRPSSVQSAIGYKRPARVWPERVETARAAPGGPR